MKQTESMKT